MRQREGLWGGDEDVTYMDSRNTHPHARVHRNNEANPSKTFEVRCSLIYQRCRSKIHLIDNPELLVDTETTKLNQDLAKGQRAVFGTQ